MSVVAFISARAGSKRLPNKNILPLAGRPLITHTCEAALSSGVLSAVYVNTDSPKIATIASACGVACPTLRPRHLATDDSPTRDSILFMLDHLASRGEHYDAVLILQPTSPLRTAEDIRRAMMMFEEHAPCSVVSVSPVVPMGWMGHIRPDGRLERWAGEDLVYRLNGAIYLYRTDDYLADRGSPKTMAYVMPPARSVDIDRREDLDYAEFLLDRSAALAGV